MLKRIRKHGLILASLIIVLAACGQDTLAPTEAPLVNEAALPTQPPEPPEPGEPPPSPTEVVAPTATLNTAPPPTVAPIPTSTSVPTAEAETPSSLTAADFGTDRNPLTGELVADPTMLDRRPMAIKISNAPAQWVRPQSGLNDADIVFEHVTEGALTRFTMLVYGKTPADVGPIRSARMIDLELPAMYDAALFYSGSSEGVKQIAKRNSRDILFTIDLIVFKKLQRFVGCLSNSFEGFSLNRRSAVRCDHMKFMNRIERICDRTSNDEACYRPDFGKL